MSEKQLNKLEQRFMQVKAIASEKQWQSPDFLRNKAVKIESDDLELAFRLMQRAHNLRPGGKVIIRKLNQYRAALEHRKSGILKSSSRVTPKTIGRSKIAMSTVRKKIEDLPSIYKKPINLIVVFPWLIFALYLILWASPRYESQSQVIVRQPDSQATMDASMAVLSGLGVSSTNTDTKLVEAYIYSADMLIYLQETLDMYSHYNDFSADFFSRLNGWATREEKLEYYLKNVLVEIDETSSVISIKTTAFSPEFANNLNETIVKRAEWYINSIGNMLATEQLKFIEGEHNLTEGKLQDAKVELLKFQQKHNLLDPSAEGMALQQITYNIEGSLSAKRAELYALESVMSPDAPQVKALKRVIESLEKQLTNEKSRLTENDKSEEFSIGEVMAKYSDYKVDVELALQAYTSSLISLEKSRIEAYRQLQYLVVIESSTFPEDNAYPQILYNLTLFAVIMFALFAIGKIVTATIKELS